MIADALPVPLLLALAGLLPPTAPVVIRPAAAAGCVWVEVDAAAIVARVEVDAVAARPVAVPAAALRRLGLARASNPHTAAILAAADGLALVPRALYGTPAPIPFAEPPLPADVADRLAPLPPWHAPPAGAVPLRGEVPADALLAAAAALDRAGVRDVEVIALPGHPTIALALRPGLAEPLGGSVQVLRSR